MSPVFVDEWKPPIDRANPLPPQPPRNNLAPKAPPIPPEFRIPAPSREDLLPSEGPETIEDLLRNAADFFTRASAPPVIARGPHDAAILLLGEAPGAVESRTGQPFTGPSGRLLDNLQRKAAAVSGHPLPGILHSNVSFWSTAGNPDPTAHRMAAAQPVLFALMEILQPAVIIATGRKAMHALTPETAGITDARGSILTPSEPWIHALRNPPPPVVPSWHPAHILHRHSPKNLIDDLVADLAAAFTHCARITAA